MTAMARSEPDAALVAAARGGDRGAFAALVERHYGMLSAICRRITGDAEMAADAAQEAVLAALLGLDRLRDDDRFAAWLAGIGINLCRRALRERARWRRPDGSEPVAADPGPDEAAAAAEIAERVRAAIAALPPGQRAAVALVRIVVLEALAGDRQLPIWIGEPEAASMVAALEDVELPRPSAHHFAGALLRAAGASCARCGSAGWPSTRSTRRLSPATPPRSTPARAMP